MLLPSRRVYYRETHTTTQQLHKENSRDKSTARRSAGPRGNSTLFGGHPAQDAAAAPTSHARTCSPLSPGNDVFPELPHRPVAGHLLVPCQALRQLDLRGELHPRNHGDRPHNPRESQPRRFAWARGVTSPHRADLVRARYLTSCVRAGLAGTARYCRTLAGPAMTGLDSWN